MNEPDDIFTQDELKEIISSLIKKNKKLKAENRSLNSKIYLLEKQKTDIAMIRKRLERENYELKSKLYKTLDIYTLKEIVDSLRTQLDYKIYIRKEKEKIKKIQGDEKL